MDSLRVATNGPSSPLANQLVGHLFRSGLDAKLRPLASVSPLVIPAAAGGCEQAAGSPPASSASASPSPASSDKTDNHDTFDFLPDAPDMRREDERLKTFDKWPVSFLAPEIFARNGFYYLGRGDEVRCAFCNVEIMRWVEGDDPAKDHQQWAPQCPFLRGLAGAGNVPLESPVDSGRDECGVRAPVSPNVVRMPGPVHPQFASKAARLRSFKHWPRCMRQKPEDLAEAGFYYTGKGDQTKCFYCDGGLKDWENDDVPWEQHARWFQRCAYVQLVKGPEYVQKVISEACAIPASNDTTPPSEEDAPAAQADETNNNKEEDAVEDSKLCKICYAEERNVCFVPCGHVVACAKCALSTNKCPMCRRTFENAVRIYFS